MTSDGEGKTNIVEIEEVFRHKEHEYVVLRAIGKLPIGKYILYFKFEGPLTLSLKGLYKSSYVDPESQEERCVFMLVSSVQTVIILIFYASLHVL